MIIALKCPECNGDIQLDDNREFGFCQYCGTKILLNSERNNRKIEKREEKENLVRLAHIEIELGNYVEAREACAKALEIDATDWKIFFDKEICQYYLNKDFQKIKDVYVFCLEKDNDEENIDYYKTEFAGILLEFSQEASCFEDFDTVYRFAINVYTSNGIRKDKFLNFLKEDLEKFVFTYKWKLNRKQIQEAYTMIEQYDYLLRR